MPTVTVERIIPAAIQDVFNILTDHANYQQFSVVDKSTLLKKGTNDVNGVGALRKIEAGRIWFLEDITGFTAPESQQADMSYLIQKTSLPIKHLGGIMTFTESTADDGTVKTHVVWKSTFESTIPVVGAWLQKKFLMPRTKVLFGIILKQTEKKLTA